MDRRIANIECPYFNGLAKQKINCERPIECVARVSVEFINNKQRDDYLNNFCSCGCWRGCALARMIEGKF